VTKRNKSANIYIYIYIYEYNACAVVCGPYFMWQVLFVTSCSYCVAWVGDQLNGRQWYDNMLNEPTGSGSQ